MKYTIMNLEKIKILKLERKDGLVENEQDALDIIGSAGSNGTRCVLMHDNLADDFYDLKTGIAGAILQKFANYSMTAAFIISRERKKGRFGELVDEANSYSSRLHFFHEEKEAVEWLSYVG